MRWAAAVTSVSGYAYRRSTTRAGTTAATVARTANRTTRSGGASGNRAKPRPAVVARTSSPYNRINRRNIIALDDPCFREETAMPRLPFALAVILVTAAFAHADILPPGSKWANHVAKFEGIAKHQADYMFYIYPRDISRGRPGNT